MSALARHVVLAVAVVVVVVAAAAAVVCLSLAHPPARTHTFPKPPLLVSFLAVATTKKGKNKKNEKKKKKKKKKKNSPEAPKPLRRLRFWLAGMGKSPKRKHNAAGSSKQQAPLASLVDDVNDIASLMKRRDRAREERDWTLADRIRDHVTALGYAVQDASGAVKPSQLLEHDVKRAKRLRKKERQADEAARRQDDAARRKRVMFLKEQLSRKGGAGAGADAAEQEADDNGADSDEDGDGGKKKKKKKEGADDEKRNTKVLAMGVRITDLVVGQGKELVPGRTVKVGYRGTLASTGQVFDSAAKFSFQLGVGDVIKGWDLGVAGMRKGGRRRIVCPPKAAYGKRKQPGIPANSTLVFDVKAL